MSTKQETIILINHAISYFKNQGKTQKDLAKALSIEESRISEMKTGRSLLSTSDKKSILDFCGHPRRDPGRYEKALCYKSVEEFTSQFGDLMKNHYIRQLIQYFQKTEHKTQLVQAVRECTKYNEYINNLVQNIAKNYVPKTVTEITPSYIDELVRQPSSISVFQQYENKWIKEKAHSRYKYTTSLTNNVVTIESQKIIHKLYLLWQVVQHHPDFRLSDESPLELPLLKNLEEVVITGENVLALYKSDPYSNYHPHSINNHSVQLFGYPENYEDDLPKPNVWKSLRSEIILSEELNYYFSVHLCLNSLPTVNFPPELDFDDDRAFGFIDGTANVQPSDLFVIIGKVPHQNLFKEIDEVRKWFCLPEDSHFELKRNIAKAGGYVPGARVLV